MKRIDLPPVWLLLACLLALLIGRRDPWGLSFGGGWADFVAGLALGGGVLLIVVSVRILRQARTAIHPRGKVTALVSSGPFGWSRNPIYVGMALILLGVVLWADAPLALPLVPVWVWWIERRFVLREEARIARDFGPAWQDYSRRVRRWL